MAKLGVTPDELTIYVTQKLRVVMTAATPASNSIYTLHTALYLVHFTQGSYTYLKFKFHELSKRKRVIFPGVFQELYMQNFTRLLHTLLSCMCRPTHNQQKCTKTH